MAKATDVTELSGIRIAEISGVNKPEAANEMPTILYIKEMTKPVLTIRIAVWLNRMNAGNCLKRSASRMPSQAGEKW